MKMKPFGDILCSFCVVLWLHCVSSEVCTKNVCEYRFVIREARTMAYTTVTTENATVSYKVVLADNGSLLVSSTPFREKVPNIIVPADKVHTVDGHTRTIITINDQFPGPAIEVTEGAQVVVTVVNENQFDDLTIHFHGMHQKNNPWMDGTAYVTQCPIGPKESFQYRFIASPAGTHWYHSHLEGQRADGLFGPLIVHRSRPSLPYMTMMVHDWYSMMSHELLLRSPYFFHIPGIGDTYHSGQSRSYHFDGSETSPLIYWSSLINGKGKHGNNSAPLSVFTVKRGHKHRIHVIFSSLEYFHSFSIDHHKLTVIESDGYPVKPVTIDSLVGYMGERFVIEITPNQPVGQYWIRATVMRTGATSNPVPDGKDHKVLAILHYEGAVDAEPRTSPRACTVDKPCKVLNCAWSTYHKVWYPNRVCIPLSDLRHDNSVGSTQENLDEKDVHEIFLNFDFSFGSSINHHRNILPRGALFQEPGTWGITPCSRDCPEKGCLCTHVINLPANSIIQMVMTSNRRNLSPEAQEIPLHHPVHLHGHSYQVLKMGLAIANSTTGRLEKPNPDIVCENNFCSKQHWAAGHPKDLNFNNPPVKDTVVVPGWGYTVVRFRTDNPGYWFSHCHQFLHQLEGMSLIFNVSGRIPSAPKNFPTCKGFSMKSQEFAAMLEQNKQCSENGHCETSTSGTTNVGMMPDVLIAILIYLGLAVYFFY